MTTGPTIENGDYVTFDRDGKCILYRATRDSFIGVDPAPSHYGHETEVVEVEAVFTDHAETFPVDLLTPAKADLADADDERTLHERDEYLADYDEPAWMSNSGRVNGGVYTLRGDMEEHFCPVCGSNAIRWSHETLSDEGGEWCAVCDAFLTEVRA